MGFKEVTFFSKLSHSLALRRPAIIMMTKLYSW